MSNSLVHKSLELVSNNELHRMRKKKNGTDIPHGSSVSTVINHEKDPCKERKKKKHKNIGYKGLLDLIPAKHRIISTDDNTDISILLGKSNRTTVYETQKRIAAQQDPTNDNIKKLLLLSNNSTKSRTTETVNNLLQRATRRKYSQKKKEPEESKETVFTEEDFKKFEREYMG